jgi:hypothetical protein
LADAAVGVHNLSNSKMMSAIRVATLHRGHDPRAPQVARVPPTSAVWRRSWRSPRLLYRLIPELIPLLGY